MPRIIYSSGPPSPWQLSMWKFSVPMAFLWTSCISTLWRILLKVTGFPICISE